jgi:hypothetical protein
MSVPCWWCTCKYGRGGCTWHWAAAAMQLRCVGPYLGSSTWAVTGCSSCAGTGTTTVCSRMPILAVVTRNIPWFAVPCWQTSRRRGKLPPWCMCGMCLAIHPCSSPQVTPGRHRWQAPSFGAGMSMTSAVTPGLPGCWHVYMPNPKVCPALASHTAVGWWCWHLTILCTALTVQVVLPAQPAG